MLALDNKENKSVFHFIGKKTLKNVIIFILRFFNYFYIYIYIYIYIYERERVDEWTWYFPVFNL